MLVPANSVVLWRPCLFRYIWLCLLHISITFWHTHTHTCVYIYIQTCTRDYSKYMPVYNIHMCVCACIPICIYDVQTQLYQIISCMYIYIYINNFFCDYYKVLPLNYYWFIDWRFMTIVYPTRHLIWNGPTKISLTLGRIQLPLSFKLVISKGAATFLGKAASLITPGQQIWAAPSGSQTRGNHPFFSWQDPMDFPLLGLECRRV